MLGTDTETPTASPCPLAADNNTVALFDFQTDATGTFTNKVSPYNKGYSVGNDPAPSSRSEGGLLFKSGNEKPCARCPGQPPAGVCLADGYARIPSWDAIGNLASGSIDLWARFDPLKTNEAQFLVSAMHQAQ